MKANPVYVPPEGSPATKPFCNICKVYHKLFKTQYCCPQCGAPATDEQTLKTNRDIVYPIDATEPMVGSRKKRQPFDSDLPEGANWLSDETISSV